MKPKNIIEYLESIEIPNPFGVEYQSVTEKYRSAYCLQKRTDTLEMINWCNFNFYKSSFLCVEIGNVDRCDFWKENLFIVYSPHIAACFTDATGEGIILVFRVHKKANKQKIHAHFSKLIFDCFKLQVDKVFYTFRAIPIPYDPTVFINLKAKCLTNKSISI